MKAGVKLQSSSLPKESQGCGCIPLEYSESASMRVHLHSNEDWEVEVGSLRLKDSVSTKRVPLNNESGITNKRTCLSEAWLTHCADCGGDRSHFIQMMQRGFLHSCAQAVELKMRDKSLLLGNLLTIGKEQGLLRVNLTVEGELRYS